MHTVKLPDGKTLSFDTAPTFLQVAEKIGPGLAKAALAGMVNGVIYDLARTVPDGATVRLLTEKDREALDVLRHSTAHIMAAAVLRVFPGAQHTIGPETEDGFWYDFEVEKPFEADDLAKIEAEMKKIIDAKEPFVRSELQRTEAYKKAASLKQRFKKEIMDDKPDVQIFSFYQTGDFADLCTGPHIPHSGRVKAFKLLSVAGSYWRGDVKRDKLQRIYGTAFFSQKDLDEHLHLLEEAKKRDHRKLGKEMGLFSFHEEAHGFPFYLPKGTVLLEALMNHMRDVYLSEGYHFVRTPILMNERLWETSGHLANYQENMYFSAIDEERYAVKPMNCPGHCLIFSEGKRSYRELPLRIAEFGLLHRHELSGVVDGIKRTRYFIQDDAHLFCTPDQIEGEILNLIKLILRTYKELGFHEFKINLATRPAKSVGSNEIWTQATAALKAALDKSGVEYNVREGDGAFYGPKIDIDIRDALKREYTLSTIQADFNLPERFKLSYIGPDGAEHRPVMIHRAICGSFDRTLGILIEHYAGHFPLWLAPEQVRILPITDRQLAYAAKLRSDLSAAGIRANIDERSEKIGYKIREATLQKIPYMLVCGDQEVSAGTIAVREQSGKDLGAMQLNQFMQLVRDRLESKT